MDLETIRESIVTKVYHITQETKVPLHKHADKDEIFYCMKGSGFGVLENEEKELTAGKAFIVQAGTNGARIGVLKLYRKSGRTIKYKNFFKRPNEYTPEDDKYIRSLINKYKSESRKKSNLRFD